MSLSLFATVLLAAGTFSEQQVDEIQQIIRDYLVEEPEVLIQASQALQEKQLKAMKEQADEVIKEKAGILFAGTSPILGNDNGTINVVEFFDYQCGHCKVVHGVLNSLIDNNQDVRLIVKAMPVLDATSVTAAKAVLAADLQGKFEPLHHKLLNFKGKLTDDKIFALAQEVGINSDQLKKDMDSDAVKQEIQENSTLFTSLGFRGTPSFVIAPNPYSPGEAAQVVPGAPSLKIFEKVIAEVKSQEATS